MDQVAEICERGANVNVDHIGIPWKHDSSDQLDGLLAERVAEMVERGFADRISMSYDRWFFNPRAKVTELESASNLGIHRPYQLADRLRRRSGLPAVVVNDTQAAAIAESARAGAGTAVLLTVGTGIGGAIVRDGKLVLGEGAAGDFGHLVMAVDGPECVCGGRGCLEQLVSGRVLDEVARDLAASGASGWLAARARGGRPLHAGDLDAAASVGDPAALAALDSAAATLALALRSVTAAADPRVIILGGGLMGADRLLPRLVRDRWRVERPPWSAAELRPAACGAEAGLRGAALLAAPLT